MRRRLSVLAMVSLAGAPVPASSAGGAAQFRAQVEMVRVGVGIYAPGDDLVPKLAAEDFRVLDNGEPQEIELFLEPDEAPLHVALVVDASGSMMSVWPEVVAAASQFLAALSPGDCAFVLPFQDLPERGQWGRRDAAWGAFFEDAEHGGGTGLREALAFALRALEKNAEAATEAPAEAAESPADETAPVVAPAAGNPAGILPARRRLPLLTATDIAVARVIDTHLREPEPEPEAGGCAPLTDPSGPPMIGSEARRAVVLLSDGRGGGSVHTLEQLSAASRTAAIPIFTVILGDAGPVGTREMIAIARVSGGLVVEARGATDLFEAFDAVMGYLDAVYVLAYRVPAPPGRSTSSRKEAEEWHEVRVELIDLPRFRAVHAAGYAR